MTSLSFLFMGVLLGVKHAMEADHLAAVATLVAKQQSFTHTIKQGMAWGMGHTLTLLLFGGAVLVMGKAVPDRMAQALELAVGVMLIGLGLDVFRQMIRNRVHFHPHRHGDGQVHFHAHSHLGEGAHALSRHAHRHVHRVPRRALFVGMMHGMAGSAALILLSLEAVASPVLGVVYIALFGLGSVIGMALLSAAIAVPLRLSARYMTWMNRALSGLVGTASCVLGGAMVYHIGFAQGLLIR